MAWFIQKPYFEHLNDVKQILRYVAVIKYLTLKYSKLPSFVLSTFFDYDYGGYRDGWKSTSTCVLSIH